MLFVPLCSFSRMGHGLGRREMDAKAANYFMENKRKVPDFLRNQELFGGDYWTRTSDLLRVKMRRDVKALLLGAFRHFWPRFLLVQITALSTVSTR